MHPATALFKDARDHKTKQATIFIGRSEGSKDSPIEKMRRKFDTYLAGSSTQTDRHSGAGVRELKNKGMDRFTLRGKQRVNTQFYSMAFFTHANEK